jgi:TPR repeat protein
MLGCIQKTTTEKEQEKEKETVKPETTNVEREEESIEVHGNSTRPISVLKPLVLNGDYGAYEELFIAYLDIGDELFLPYALLMANKYYYPPAYNHVFHCLTSIYQDYDISKSLSKLDAQTRKMALDYLKKGARLDEKNSLWKLGQLYMKGIYVEKDTVLGNQLLEKAFKKEIKSF